MGKVNKERHCNMTVTHMSAGERRRTYTGPAVFAHGFRPFFLFGALYAGCALPVWLVALFAGLELPGAITSIDWHIHEMIFGFLAAIIAGFILTAVPNWTGRLPVVGGRLAALFAVWLAGRVGVAFVQSAWIVMVIDCAFLFLLAGVLWREVLSGKNWRNVPVCGLVTLLALANIMFHLGLQYDELAGYGMRTALGVAAVLMGLIGGRVTPSFTRNWMAKLKVESLPAPFGRFDQATLIAAGVAMVSWIFWPDSMATGAALIFAGMLHVGRLFRWRGGKTLSEPIVAVLHLGYGWLAVSFILMGAAILAPSSIEPSVALHALTTGAIGTMTLAVMTRASLGHTGRTIKAAPATLLIYALVSLGALLRVGAGILPVSYEYALVAGGTAWSLAFLVFFVSYAPALLSSRS